MAAKIQVLNGQLPHGLSADYKVASVLYGVLHLSHATKYASNEAIPEADWASLEEKLSMTGRESFSDIPNNIIKSAVEKADKFNEERLGQIFDWAKTNRWTQFSPIEYIADIRVLESSRKVRQTDGEFSASLEIAFQAIGYQHR